MVQAILAGRKTQTRRVVKPQPLHDISKTEIFVSGSRWGSRSEKQPDGSYSIWNTKCPYGQPGDVLWVRETWQETTWLHPSNDEYGYIYKASENGREWAANDESWTWKPSIYMPKDACRIFLRITNVRVERLQDISAADCYKEGACSPTSSTPKLAWQLLWQSINGPESWNTNPFVWVVEFERIEKPQ
jgi:hypothetical protein